MKQVSPISIAHITDIHLFASEDEKMLLIPTRESFEAVVERLKALSSEIDILLLTGDLSGDGKPESYDHLQSILNSLKIPVYCLPGNHDHTGIMSDIFNMGMVSRRKSFQRGGWNFILLDSSQPGCVHGYLNGKTLDWLNYELKMLGESPTLIALHHPPCAVNSLWLDSISLKNPQEFLTIIDRHPQVKLVLFGHIHQEFQHQRHQVHYLSSPSTGVQFRSSTATLTIDKQYPGFRLLKLYPNGMWETAVERVPYFHPLQLTAQAG
ncbi:phosphodiesterase [Chrysosporum bergii ANA360D]|jgi:Icc protein|uniref:Phosphodiesterase n=1 Tax=Chrysosporum bergii ANA360D TaxID=617107 RepID=A0AA43GT69_9CYAN|nr:phosphodiesterase [Chrysosporum bergii]MDH6061131.1 phosphodiesterase [Chrysosporum bergii ANA360D]